MYVFCSCISIYFNFIFNSSCLWNTKYHHLQIQSHGRDLSVLWTSCRDTSKVSNMYVFRNIYIFSAHNQPYQLTHTHRSPTTRKILEWESGFHKQHWEHSTRSHLSRYHVYLFYDRCTRRRDSWVVDEGWSVVCYLKQLCAKCTQLHNTSTQIPYTYNTLIFVLCIFQTHKNKTINKTD